MTISTKSAIVLNTPISRKASRLLQKSGIHITTARTGVGLGVETSARTRVSAKQSERIRSASKMAGRISFLAKRHVKAKRLAATGTSPTQEYATAEQGGPPTTASKMRSNIAIVTGDRTEGACLTAILPWHFDQTKHFADPAFKLPNQQIGTWVRLWLANNVAIDNLTGLWSKLYRQLDQAKNR